MNTITIEVSDDEMETLEEFEALLGLSPEEFTREAFEGGLQRAEEFLESDVAEKGRELLDEL